MMNPATRIGLRVIAPGHVEIRWDRPYPLRRPDYVIAETKAFALNPTDNHHIDSLAGTEPIIGCDWSGIVREVGENLTQFKPGDAVFGACHGVRTSALFQEKASLLTNVLVEQETRSSQKTVRSPT